MCRKKLDTLAGKLTAIRQEAAERFADMVKKALLELNFLEVSFELAFKEVTDYTPNGKDEVLPLNQ